MPSSYTFQETQDLIKMPKIILDVDGNDCPEKEMTLKIGFREDINLRSVDNEFFFKWSIHNRTKDVYRLTLHVCEKDTSTGIIRVDFVPDTECHPNPRGLTDEVPNELKAYLGMDIYGPHAHFNVKGYKELTWAIPLKDVDYKIKSVIQNDGVVDLASPILEFADYIAIQTPITIQTSII